MRFGFSVSTGSGCSFNMSRNQGPNRNLSCYNAPPPPQQHQPIGTPPSSNGLSISSGAVLSNVNSSLSGAQAVNMQAAAASEVIKDIKAAVASSKSIAGSATSEKFSASYGNVTAVVSSIGETLEIKINSPAVQSDVDAAIAEANALAKLHTDSAAVANIPVSAPEVPAPVEVPGVATEASSQPFVHPNCVISQDVIDTAKMTASALVQMFDAFNDVGSCESAFRGVIAQQKVERLFKERQTECTKLNLMQDQALELTDMTKDFERLDKMGGERKRSRSASPRP